MTMPGMIEGSFNMPISIDQLTSVVNSLVEVTSGNTLPPPLSGNTLMSSPTVLPVVTPTVSDSSNLGNNCFSQVIPTQPASGFVGGNNMSSVHIPVSLTAQTVSMVPLMLSLNLANRSLTSPPDRNTIDRAFLPTGAVNDKINSIVYSCANSSINQQVSAAGPITLPTVSMSVMENDSTGCSSLAHPNSLDCVPNETALHQPSFQQISTVSYSSPTDNQTHSQDLNSTNPLIAASIQEPLAPNPSMMTPNLSTLADLRLGVGVVSQPDTYASLPDSLSSLLQVANQFGQGQMQKNNITTAPCVLQTTGDDRTLADASISAEQPLSANGLQSLLHQRPSELASSLDSLGLLPEKDNTNLVSSAMVLDVANMSVIDMILKVQHAESNNIQNSEKIPECEEMTNTQLKGDNSAAVPTEMPQFAFEHFCLDCNAQLQNPCQIHNNNYSEISDSPLLTRARLSLPSMLHLKNTSAQGYNNELGVWTKEAIPRKSRFGPLTAKVKSKCQVNCEKTKDFPIWMIFFPGESLADLLDVSDENECNWMMFVKPARTVAEQNLVAYQHHANIYFITSCDLQPHQELLVWYSKDYAQAIGVSAKADVPLNCSVCDTIFASHKRLSQHLKENHPEISVRRWRCQFCSRGFTSTTKLKTHLLTHIGVKPHSCNECGKQFTDQSNLRMHQTIHTGVRNFSCYVCQKQFRQKAHLKSHMFTHTGEKSLKCQFCDKMFSRSSDLKQHEYQHTKEKIFCCSHCDKSFYKMQNFKKHLKIHSGERNFSCTMCAKSFYTKYHLKRHSSSCKGNNSVVRSGTMMVLSEDVGLTLDDATDIVNEEVFQDNNSEVEEDDESVKVNGSNRLADIDFTDDQ